MEALRATYGSDSDDGGSSPPIPCRHGDSREDSKKPQASDPLPPPPLDLLRPPNFVDFSSMTQGSRVRNFPHVEGNYALHVFIPVLIPSNARKQLVRFMKKLAYLVPNLYAVDADYALDELCKDDQKLEQVLLSREFHISLGRTVAIQVHQIDSIVAMLRQRFQSQRRLGHWIIFNKLDFFINDDRTRSFLSFEVTGTGLPEISKKIDIVNEIYRLHGLPEFYKDPRPHISLVWALGDISSKLKQAIEELNGSQNNASSSQMYTFKCMFDGIVCKIGKKTYSICKLAD
ncbi:U6 snRNA phosphodiesterase [Ananas comosus]|uniref:U6 snRNA phosphodiesterase n=1 Tax=Ananas comosus TaxID=4615 RepID=A0A199USP1_ANACO|nr:U6 snRNA phosphodiesterase [Ananas comosus]